ncbi:Lrp/AsnC family transcriptional regulator [Chelatococcus daeguensis]|uniref:AsnC family transcriptional regulator n=2 Tax=Chelatococcus TaxID=28209 RepID=A0AAC9JNB4_9HYPH|nr:MULTISPECIES: Lrp/AsnC family transcriptional regulator [Chelatococcus]APF36613.1 AsnC family transcriptional regulator [Chelatococcus daeguensis]KZE33394.1 AsnC family transcriptional regulator [Chelatococcus daeguensis]MBM3082929.1 Lrp/AsnC family transcriptional regulator [Chelatococcus daeguensis]CUA90804.1 transcriptional regulator, AsnC family [Chelatococcus sambhunathii]
MTGAPKLDRIDLNILVELQKNGRMTNVALAEAVGLSPSPCLQRVKRLEAARYIAAYGATINLAKLGQTVMVFTEMTLHDHRREDFVRFESFIRTVDEVMECHLVSGGYDYLVRFITRGVLHYQEVMDRIIERNVGIANYFSYIVLKSPLVRTEYPLTTLFREED